LKKFHFSVGELDDANALTVDCIFNVSLILASKSFYSGVPNFLEYYVDTGLISPVTRVTQMRDLLPAQEIRRKLEKRNCQGIGFSQGYKLQGAGKSFTQYLMANGRGQPRTPRGGWHRISRHLVEATAKTLTKHGISDYGCVHLRLGDFANYCKLGPRSWANTDDPSNSSSIGTGNECFVSDKTVEKCVSSFSSKMRWLAVISNDMPIARSMVERAISKLNSNISVFSPQDLVIDKYPEFGAIDRVVCSFASEVIVNQYSTFSQDIAGRMFGYAKLMYIGDWEWRKPW
jgi:hypothetical protein